MPTALILDSEPGGHGQTVKSYFDNDKPSGWTASVFDLSLGAGTVSDAVDQAIANGDKMLIRSESGVWNEKNEWDRALDNGILTVHSHGSNSNTELTEPPRLFSAVTVGGESPAGGYEDERSFGPGLEVDGIAHDGSTAESWATPTVAALLAHLYDHFSDPGLTEEQTWLRARSVMRQLALDNVPPEDWFTVGTYNGQGPRGIAVYDGDLYVVNRSSEDVSRWDGNSWDKPGTYNGAQPTHAVVYNGDLYVTNASSNDISRWDGSSWDKPGTYNGFDPSHLAVYNDDLYVTNELSDDISRWDGTSWDKPGTYNGSEPIDLAVYDDALYVANYGSDDVSRWENGSWDKPGRYNGESPYGVAAHDGRLYVSNIINNDISRWDGSSWDKTGGYDGQGPIHFAVYNESLHVTNQNTDDISRLFFYSDHWTPERGFGLVYSINNTNGNFRTLSPRPEAPLDFHVTEPEDGKVKAEWRPYDQGEPFQTIVETAQGPQVAPTDGQSDSPVHLYTPSARNVTVRGLTIETVSRGGGRASPYKSATRSLSTSANEGPTLTASRGTDGTVSLSLPAVDGAAGYAVEERRGPGHDWTSLAIDVDASGDPVTASRSPVDDHKPYEYRVRIDVPSMEPLYSPPAQVKGQNRAVITG